MNPSGREAGKNLQQCQVLMSPGALSRSTAPSLDHVNLQNLHSEGMHDFLREKTQSKWNGAHSKKCRCAAKNAVNSNNSQVLPHKIQALQLWEETNKLLFIELHLALRLKKLLDVSTPLHFV